MSVGAMPKNPRIVRFAAFEVNLDSGELRRQGVKLRLPEQAFQVLAMLLEHAGEVVRREELRDRLWPRETFVDFDHGLNKAINRLREVLNDSAGTPRFIETVARRGYRLIAPISAGAPPRGALRAPSKLRLVVLPFENLSADPGQEFFSDGLTEEMISELGRLNPTRLGVIARTSAMQYKHTPKRIDEIGRELEVDYILEGSVRRAESRVRITVQLIHAADQTHLWAESFNRELADIFQVQHEIARRVAASLAFELLPKDHIHEKVVSPGAHEAYLRGRYFWNKESDRDAKAAIECFEKALEHDPEYALAYSGISDCYLRLGLYFVLQSTEAGERAKAAAVRALDIDERLAEAHTSIASVYCWYDWNWAEAEREFQRAIELKPNYAAAHFRYAAYLNVMRRFEEAAAEQKIAEELDPLSLIITMTAADPYYYCRQYPLAIEQLQRVLKREPNFPPAYANLGRAYAQSGMHQEAIAASETAARLSRVPQADLGVAYAYAKAGEKEKAKAILQRMQELAATHYVPSPYLASIYLGLGEFEAALGQLEQGLNERSYLMIFINVDPIYDSIRSHPRFEALLDRMNLRAYSAG